MEEKTVPEILLDLMEEFAIAVTKKRFPENTETGE